MCEMEFRELIPACNSPWPMPALFASTIAIADCAEYVQLPNIETVYQP